MHYIRHYSISPFDYKLWEKLLEYGVECRCYPPNAKQEDYTGMGFHLDESIPKFSELEPYLPEATQSISASEISAGKPCVFITYKDCYTEKERESAKWLEMRGISLKLSPINDETLWERTCILGVNRYGIPLSNHHVQVEPLVVGHAVRWSNSQFFSGSYNTNYIFCSGIAKDILENSGLRGFRFDPVLKGKQKGQLADTWQLRSCYTVPNGAFLPIRYMEESICPDCGIQILHFTDGRYLYGVKEGMLNPNVDFYETLPSFGGYPGTSCGTEYLISRRGYQMLRSNKMTRGVEFIPLQVISERIISIGGGA